jgi:hypothetical protein
MAGVNQTVPFEPTAEDLRNVQAYLRSEIKRLEKRLAEVTADLGVALLDISHPRLVRRRKSRLP